ncbi:unnamed protein product, partial [Didymodactylos carnosus]
HAVDQLTGIQISDSSLLLCKSIKFLGYYTFHAHKDENPKAKIIEIAKMMDVTITHDDIEVAHFTGAKNVQQRDIIARFYSRETCQKLLKNRKKL